MVFETIGKKERPEFEIQALRHEQTALEQFRHGHTKNVVAGLMLLVSSYACKPGVTNEPQKGESTDKTKAEHVEQESALERGAVAFLKEMLERNKPREGITAQKSAMLKRGIIDSIHIYFKVHGDNKKGAYEALTTALQNPDIEQHLRENKQLRAWLRGALVKYQPNRSDLR